MRRKEPRIKYGSPLYHIIEYTLLIAGAFCIAVSFNLFTNPNRIASGGVAGISTVLEAVLGWEPGLTQWAFNIPLFIAGLIFLGRAFGLKTAVGTVILPLFVLLTSNWSPATDNLLLASVFGGIGVGLGLGLVFRGKGSTGGLDLLAQIVHKFTGLTHGLSVAMLDGLVIICAGLVFTLEEAMYALIGLFVTKKTIDAVQVGISYAKVAFIISDMPERIEKAILYDLDRGLTKLSGYGGYTGNKKTVCMVVISHTEVTRLKAIVRDADPNAFVILSDTAEVLGEGFKLTT